MEGKSTDEVDMSGIKPSGLLVRPFLADENTKGAIIYDLPDHIKAKYVRKGAPASAFTVRPGSPRDQY